MLTGFGQDNALKKFAPVYPAIFAPIRSRKRVTRFEVQVPEQAHGGKRCQQEANPVGQRSKKGAAAPVVGHGANRMPKPASPSPFVMCRPLRHWRNMPSASWAELPNFSSARLKHTLS